MQKKNIAIAAPLTSYSGYGQYGRAIALMLIDLYKNDQNITIFLFDFTGNTLSQSEKFNLKNSKFFEIESYINSLEKMQTQFFDIFITVAVPQAFLQKGLTNIGITALGEVDKIHPQLIEYCNRMDEVLVMSDYNIETLKRSMYKLKDEREIKINVPIDKIGIPFIPIKSCNKTDITDFLDEIPQKFLFLTVGEWLPGSIGNDRKDIGALISTFLKGFANNQNMGLVLKVNQGRSSILSQYNMRERINEICRGLGLKISYNNIYFVSGNLAESQMLELYKHDKIKAYISFTHGESLGLPIIQFIGNTGKPALIPYHSGMLEYIKPEYSQILIHKETQVHPELFQSFMREFLIPESKWYTVDYQYALFKMADIFNNYDNISKRTINQQNNILENYSKVNLENQLKRILDKYIISQQEFNQQ